MRRALAAVLLAAVGCTSDGGVTRPTVSPTATSASPTPSPAPTLSPTPSPSPSETSASARCGDAATTLDMNDCLNRALADLERRLAAALRAARAVLGPEGQRALDESQRDFLRYRDSACHAVAAKYEGGSFAGPAAGFCRVGLTEERLVLVDSIAEEG